MNKINKFFQESKSVPLDLFLDKVLYHKDLGYYQKKNPFGKKGDFITAPNISNLFGEMITIWFVSFWKKLNKPKKINFIEMGPGNGDLCLTVLKTLKNFPEVYNSTNIILYEKSKMLRKIQKQRILSKKVSWIQKLSKIKSGPVVFFGNEFLDALPIKQFKKINGIIFEKYVKIGKKNVNFFFKKSIKKEIKKLESFKIIKNEGIIEYPEYGFKELRIVCNKIKKLNGGALFIDYGYINEHNTDTLQSVFKHKYNNIEKNIGKADITYLVNFSLLNEFFLKKKIKVKKIVNQKFFLEKMGILERAKILKKKMTHDERERMDLTLMRLLNPRLMGGLFKVIFAYKSKKNNFLGFK